MGDSQNWSSFDEPKAPVAKKTPTPKQEPKKTDASLVDSFRSMDLMFFRNRLIFGGLVGFCTGATFGAIDAVKLYNRQYGKFALAGMSSVTRGSAITGGSFATFFLAYQGAKTVLEVQRGTNDIVNPIVSTLVAGAPFIRSTYMRQNAPYALMLVVLDHFHEEINEYRK